MRHYTKLYLFIVICVISSNNAFADISSYRATRAFKETTKNFVITHYHDYSYRKENERRNIFSYGPNAIFSDSLNSYSYILAISKTSGDTLFKKPCPPLTKIVVSKDEKYIIGLSEIKLNNPYELVIFDTTGNLLYKRNIGGLKFELTEENLKQLIQLFPKSFQLLMIDEAIVFEDEKWQISPSYRSIRDTSLRSFLLKLPMQFNDNIFIRKSESVTNFIYWFDNKNPAVTIIEKKGKINQINITDNEKIPRSIKVNHTVFNRDYFIKNGYIDDKFPRKLPHMNVSSEMNKEKGENFFYFQIGNLNEYYSNLETFLKQDKLQFIDPDKTMVCAILSFSIYALYDDTCNLSFKIQGDRISDDLKTQLKEVKNVEKLFFEDIKVFFEEPPEMKNQIRTCMPFSFTIL